MTFAIAATIVVIAAMLGVVLTLVTLPGIWMMLLVAMLCWWWQPTMFEPWTIITVAVVALLAEAAEFLASALGSKGAGGSKWGAIGSIIGSLVGAIVGTPFFPVIGTILGAVLGAGIGAFGFEMMFDKRQWRESFRSGQGAAIGRLLSTVIKSAFSAAAAVLLIIGAIFQFA